MKKRELMLMCEVAWDKIQEVIDEIEYADCGLREIDGMDDDELDALRDALENAQNEIREAIGTEHLG